MGPRPPQIKVEKASGGSSSGGSGGLYQGGLGKAQKLADERKEQREEKKETLRLNPRFPYAVVRFDPAFFNIPAAPPILPDGDEGNG